MMDDQEKITIKESYEVMLDFLRNWHEFTGNEDVTDILSGALYFKDHKPIDPVFWEYWIESLQRVKNQENNPYNSFKDV